MHKSLNWFARISGLVVLVFYLAYFFKGGLRETMLKNGYDLIFFILFFFPALIGYITSWFKPYAGGIILVLGSLLLGSYFVYHSDFYIAMIFGIPPLLIGLSFVASVQKELVWWRLQSSVASRHSPVTSWQKQPRK